MKRFENDLFAISLGERHRLFNNDVIFAVKRLHGNLRMQIIGCTYTDHLRVNVIFFQRINIFIRRNFKQLLRFFFLRIIYINNCNQLGIFMTVDNGCVALADRAKTNNSKPNFFHRLKGANIMKTCLLEVFV